MTNADIIKAITTNLEATVSKSIGLQAKQVNIDVDEDGSVLISAGDIPSCHIVYEGENFEEIFNQRPSYNQGLFEVRVIMNKDGINVKGKNRVAQDFIHDIRAVVVNADNLNIGDLATEKPVNSVSSDGATVDHSLPDISIIQFPITVKYREAA